MTLEKQLTLDSRFGAGGWGIYLLPFGIIASLLSFLATLRGVFSSELLAFNSAKLIIIWLLLASAAAFFLMLFVGGCRILFQARHTIQRIEGIEKITLKPFAGASINLAREEIAAINLIAPDKALIPISLLSRKKENWKLILNNGRQYLINGELPGLEQHTSRWTISA